jgi:hypothetical protein
MNTELRNAIAVRVYDILHLGKAIRFSGDVDQTVQVRKVVYLIVDDFISIEFNQPLSVSRAKGL